MKRALTAEWLRVEGGQLGFLVLLSTITVHFWIAVLGPDGAGRLFRGGVILEAFGQSALLVAPLLSVYLGVRSFRRQPHSLLTCFTVVGGVLLTCLTTLGLLLVFLPS